MTGFAAAAVTYRVEARIERGSLDEAGGAAAAGRLLDAERSPTAILVTNFNQVFGALAAIRARSLAIPRDVSVIAADDDPVFDFLEPPQTAFRRDHDELGTAAVDALLEQMAGSPAARRRAELGARADRARIDGAAARAAPGERTG